MKLQVRGEELRVVAIVQARMGSKRLPGKVLKRVLGKPLLEFQIERMKRSKTVDQLVIATSLEEKDSEIVRLCERLDVECYRGSELDVLQRYYKAATHYLANAVVRISADCPLIDPHVMDEVIATYLDQYPAYNFVTNSVVKTYPLGMDIAVFSYQLLKEAHFAAKEPYEREHVTPWILEKEDLLLKDVLYSSNESHYRWTVDTKEDFTLIKKILEKLYPNNPTFTLEDVLELMSSYPELKKINEGVKQRGKNN